jgi:lysophospholipase L1-like esterase
MKYVIKFLFLQAFLLNMQLLHAQLPIYSDSIFSTYYHQRLALFKLLPKTENDVVFLGNSITDGAEWSELFKDNKIKNRGISGDISAGILHRIDDIAKGRPATLFLMIGVNDLARGISVDSVVKNILIAVDYMHQQSPRTKIIVQSILPVTDVYKKFGGHTSKAHLIRLVNEKLNVAAKPHQFTYLDVYNSFLSADGKLDKRYTNDGLHLMGEGYMLWKHLVYPYVYQLTNKPALLPAPQKIEWGNTFFPLYKTESVVIENGDLENEGRAVVVLLKEIGITAVINKKVPLGLPHIALKIVKADGVDKNGESYRLNVDDHKVTITASTPHGIFNGIQTLRQLMRDGVIIPGCDIQDWPAFSWRGFMIDVGRNYLPIDMLKEQIEVMAQYKMNVFHFHPTEDIAWRIQIKQYPQLTAPEHMLRDKGKYYSVAEVKDLIQFCKERHITFIPEIDMPGHSAAFKRAMGTDMQSVEGKKMVENILNEICETYDIPYIHIGSDEVRIIDTSFVPQMTSLIENKGKQVIGWEPGGNFKPSTIRQLWREEVKTAHIKEGLRFIDSKHLYLNHMDPLEAVVTIYNRQIAYRDLGDSLAMGAILCVWHDRAISDFSDILSMNPVYPGMLSFAERSWRGGGTKGWIANINDGDLLGFEEFEQRLLAQRTQYFSDKLFPYTAQSNLNWNLYGPYTNDGILSQSFPIEKQLHEGKDVPVVLKQRGGTIVLRHWWTPWIKGAIDQPKENTTWYASTQIWSDEDRVGKFWIGFDNLSRNTNSDSPPLNSWSYNDGRVWVNGEIINPPSWQRPGQKGNSEIPLVDEGYEYRKPTLISLKQGWNKILIKIPMGSFKARAAQHPNKWMFTFAEVK